MHKFGINLLCGTSIFYQQLVVCWKNW